MKARPRLLMRREAALGLIQVLCRSCNGSKRDALAGQPPLFHLGNVSEQCPF